MAYKPNGPPVTREEEERVRALLAAGKSRAQIAREIGRSTSTVLNVVHRLGLAFDRAGEAAAATAAKQSDNKARRAALMSDLLDDATRMRTLLFAETKYISHGGKDHVRREWTQAMPTYADMRNLMQSIGVAV